MRTIIYENYGPPAVLQVRDAERPVPQADEVLIQVRATTVSAVECALRNGDPLIARLFVGVLKPICTTPGEILSGEVIALGKDVTHFKLGDRVFGSTKAANIFVAAGKDWGAYAQYKCLPQGAALALKPSNLNDEESAGLCEGALTALPFLRDGARIEPGQKILINGASGSIGSVAVQLAKYFGAEVTGVCSTANVELVRGLGADHVIDYTAHCFETSEPIYDIIFDAAGKSSFSRSRRCLTPAGVYLTTSPNLMTMLQMLWTAKTSGKKALFMATGLRPLNDKVKDLVFVKQLAEAGKLRPVIDQRFTLRQIVAAHAYVEQGRKRGSVVVAVQE